jgi:signal transduction histidine kinase
MELMSDIVWSINPKNDRMDMIFIRMRQYASEILEAAQINFSLDMDDQCSQLALTIEKRKNLYLIFKEAINNLAKYSRASEVTIRLQLVNRILQLTITDNGVGFDPEEKYAGNGLKNMKSRAKEIHGELSIHSRSGGPTKIVLRIPSFP